MTINVFQVYVCTNEECNSYYGSSSMGRLEEQWNSDLKGDKTTRRDRCPTCGQNRVRRWARLIPADEVATAEKAVSATFTERMKPTPGPM